MAITSCYKEEILSPVINEVVAPETGIIREPIEFKLKGEGDFFVVWPGDTTHRYTEIPLNYNTGIEMRETDEENVYSAEHRYIFPGTYEVVFIVSSTGDFGNDLEKVTETRTIVVSE